MKGEDDLTRFIMNPKRQREQDIMDVLAGLLRGDLDFDSLKTRQDIRILGYAAELVYGTIDDPEKRLQTFIKRCKRELEVPEKSGQYVDLVQARWRSPVHLDVRKLRSELPLCLISPVDQGVSGSSGSGPEPMS